MQTARNGRGASKSNSFGRGYSNEQFAGGNNNQSYGRGRSGFGRGNNLNYNNNNNNKSFGRGRMNKSFERNGGKLPHFDEMECIIAPKLQPAIAKNNVKLISNVYPITTEDKVVYRYDILIKLFYNRMKPIELTLRAKNDYEYTHQRKKCSKLVRALFKKEKILSENGAYAYDRSKTLFTNECINKFVVGKDFSIKYEDMDPFLKEMLGRCNVLIKISRSEKFDHKISLKDFTKATDKDLTLRDDSLKIFFDILTNNSALESDEYFSFGRGRLFLENGAKIATSKDLFLGEGKHLSVGIGKGVCLIKDELSNEIFPALVLDSKKSVFYDSLPLLQFLMSALNLKQTPVLKNESDFIYFVKRIRFIINNLQLIRTNTQGSFVATDISPVPAGKLIVESGISLLQMYGTQKININPDLPAVVVRKGKNKSYFPLEILVVAPYQRVSLDKQTSALIRQTIKKCAIPPHQRFQEITQHLKALNLHSDSSRLMNAFSVSVSKEPQLVNAHRRDEPNIEYLNKSVVKVNAENASWVMGNENYVLSAVLQVWFVLYNDPNDAEIVKTFTAKLTEVGESKGMKFGETSIKNVALNSLDALFEQIVNLKGKKHSFVMYIDSLKDSHDYIKYLEAYYRIITQHVHSDTVRDAIGKEGRTKLENIINKMNCKNFGQCYGIVPDSFISNKWLSSGKTLVVGYDISHPQKCTRIERRLKNISLVPSVLGISYNAARFPETFIGDFAYQEPKQEEATSSILVERIQRILHLFQQNRGSLPDLIVVTRDGVSDGQFRMVLDKEIPALKRGIEKFSVTNNLQNYVPKIVCVVVCKRHCKRFAVLDDTRIINCLPSTVVDRDVTRCDLTEFYMQSHKVLKGTGKMPSYNVLLNEAEFNMDEIQSFMLALCYNHQIVNQAVSIPESIFQAHEWAKRGKNNFNALINDCGEQSLPKIKVNGEVIINWDEVTKSLCYMGGPLELSRSNA